MHRLECGMPTIGGLLAVVPWHRVRKFAADKVRDVFPQLRFAKLPHFRDVSRREMEAAAEPAMLQFFKCLFLHHVVN